MRSCAGRSRRWRCWPRSRASPSPPACKNFLVGQKVLSARALLCPECSSDFIQPRQETQMNWDRIQGNWKQMKGKVREQWGKLTDDEFDRMAGNRDQLVGKIQERYGVARDEAERQVQDWEG